MKNFILIPNENKDVGLRVTRKAEELIHSFGGKTLLKKEYDTSAHNDFMPEAVIVIGGDGSILDASVYALELDLPILGINLGRVGYLSEVEADNLSLLLRLENDEFKIKEQNLLSVSCGGVTEKRRAVNDIVISHGSYFGLSEFEISVAGGNNIRYRADGVIFSTPAGSTAYSLSAGGPVISADLDAVCITPICPHSFFNRSILFGAGDVISLKNISRDGSDMKISVDGRTSSSLAAGETAEIFRAGEKLRMLTFAENNMFDVLFKKMKMTEM